MRRGPAVRWGHGFSNEGLLALMHPKPSGDKDLTVPFHCLCLSRSTGNNTVSMLKYAAITCRSSTDKNHNVKSLAASKRQRKEENTADTVLSWKSSKRKCGNQQNVASDVHISGEVRSIEGTWQHRELKFKKKRFFKAEQELLGETFKTE